MQKREADWIGQQRVNQGLMNRQIFKLQTELQDQKTRNIPAPLQLGPSLSAQNAQVEEALKTMKAEHQKAIAEMNSSMDNRLLQAKVSADKEHRNEISRKQDQIDQMNKQNEKLNAMIGKQKEQQKVKDEAKSKQSRTRSQSETPTSKTEWFPIKEDEATAEEEEEPDDDQENEEEDDNYWNENDGCNEDWPSPPGWAWNSETKAWDRTTTGNFQYLDDEERFQFARQSEAAEINFDDWQGPGRVLMYTINVRETVQLASITPEKASIWVGLAESPEVTCWRQLPPDPVYLKKFSQKCGKGVMKLIVKRPELKARVEIIKIELSRTHKMLSGRVLYWMILHELRQSHNTIGLMNINDLSQVNCRGPKVHHLRMFQTHWDKCLANFKDLQSEGTLEPLYTKQAKMKDAFKLFACKPTKSNWLQASEGRKLKGVILACKTWSGSSWTFNR